MHKDLRFSMSKASCSETSEAKSKFQAFEITRLVNGRYMHEAAL